MSIDEILGANIRDRREYCKRSKTWLAQAMTTTLETSWSRWTVARLEAGQRETSVRELFAVALCLGTDPATLLGTLRIELSS